MNSIAMSSLTEPTSQLNQAAAAMVDGPEVMHLALFLLRGANVRDLKQAHLDNGRWIERPPVFDAAS